MSTDNNNRSTKSDTFSINTAVQVNRSRNNVTNSTDITNSYIDKARQATEQSQLRVQNIGSEEFTTERMAKNLDNSSSSSAGRRILSNTSLSKAYYVSLLNKKKGYSEDAIQVLKEVKDFSKGDIHKINIYSQETVNMKDGKFKHTVLQQDITRYIDRQDISILYDDKSLKGTAKSFFKVMGKEARATYNEQMLHYAKKPQTIKEMIKSNLPSVVSSINSAINTAGNTLLTSDDLGAQTAKASITFAQVSFKVIKTSGKIGTETFLLPIKLRNLPSAVRDSIKKGAQGILIAKQEVINTAKNIKSSVKNGLHFVKNTAKTIHTYGIVSKVTLSKVGSHSARVALTAVRGATKTAVHATAKGAVDLIHGKPFKIVSDVSMGATGLLGMSENEYVRGTGTAIQVTNYAIKTGITTSGHVVKTAAKNTVSTVKTGYQAAKMLKERGLKQSMRHLGSKVSAKFAKTGRDIVQGIKNGFKALIGGAKAWIAGAVALLVIVVLVGGGMMVTTTVFSGVITIVDTVQGFLDWMNNIHFPWDNPDTFSEVSMDFDIEELLNNEDVGVPKLREDYITNLSNYLNGRGTNIVRIRLAEGREDDVVNLAEGELDTNYREAIESVMYTDKQIIDIIKPVYQAKLLVTYDLQPKKEQAQECLEKLFKELFPSENKDFDLITTKTTEKCGQSQATGEGTAHDICIKCGTNHLFPYSADDNCPNSEEAEHTSYYCSYCDEEWHTCKAKSNVCGINGEKIMNGDEPLEISGHWTGYSEEINLSSGEILNEQHFRRHGCSCSEYVQKDCIIVLYIYYTNDREFKSWYTEKNDFTDSTLSINGQSYSCYEHCNDYDEHFKCSGYKICKGHSVSTTTLSLSGYETLLNKEFIEPMNELKQEIDKAKTKTDLSEEERKKLEENEKTYSELQENLEMCYEYQDLLFDKYISVNDFKKETLLEEDGVNQGLVDFALKQVGSVKGENIYKKYYYNGDEKKMSRDLDWSGCFIVFCMEKQNENLTLNVLREASARNLFVNHKSNVLFRENAETGEDINKIKTSKSVVLLSFTGDKIPQRCGLVIGKTSDHIFVVEGNCAGRVCIKKYKYTDPQIVGYIQE